MDPPRERLSCPHEGCAYSTLRPGLLKSHESGHTGVFPFQCDEGDGCEFAATTGNVLKQHKRIAHREMELLACPSTACDYMTVYASTMRIHSRVHARAGGEGEEGGGGGPSFLCPAGCGFTAATSTHIKRHEKLKHSDPEGFLLCLVPGCNYRSKRRHDMNKHVKFVHPAGNFVCPQCPDLPIASRKDYLSHVNTHNSRGQKGEKRKERGEGGGAGAGRRKPKGGAAAAAAAAAAAGEGGDDGGLAALLAGVDAAVRGEGGGGGEGGLEGGILGFGEGEGL